MDTAQGKPQYGRALAGLLLVGAGVVFLAGAMLLPIGYSIAESDDLGLLITSMVALAAAGGVCIALGRTILRP